MYKVIVNGVMQTVTLTGDVDDDLDAIESLEAELGVQLFVPGLSLGEPGLKFSVHHYPPENLCSLHPFVVKDEVQDCNEDSSVHQTCAHSLDERYPPLGRNADRCAPTTCAPHSPEEDEPFNSKEHRGSKLDYSVEIADRHMYHDPELHVALLKILVSLMLTEDGHLDPLICAHDQVSLSAGQRMDDADVCMVLYHHLNHPQNKQVLPSLYSAVQAIGETAVRLLRLLVHDLFPGDMYGIDTHHLARGTFASIQKLPFLVAHGEFSEAPVYIAQKVCLHA